ncbi:serine/threonine protein kinase [Paenibacillus glycanilyticus]|uniref:non-specific serine/threonine protein kinase n=1 Tax=Paenibacillus glycanilyticus TaxID=126569 RepID=A0ABQ6G8X9_9BACL|nr:protein kinase family protein [Paenibacillus glycanilyticus]GLX67409.1 serine/threonine protein kinase [Paenibacillus glycanilyticus]
MDYPLRQGMLWAGIYRIDEFLGMGSYGQTYRCSDLRDGSTVLLKRAKPSKRATGRRLLKRENDLLRQLAHPQMPRWLDWSKHRRETALVMEYIEGLNVEQAILLQERTYTQLESLRMLQDLLPPLEHLHHAGYVHRDVRIPNVILSGEEIYLIDLGLACRIGEANPDGQERDREAAPSGFADSWGAVKHRMRQPEEASDLYGLGHFFLFLMYAGYIPEEGQTELSWEEELALDPMVKSFVKGLLESRWRSAAECRQQLEKTIHHYSSGNNK